MEADVLCPYCGEPIVIWIDQTGGASQRYVEDCSICCEPIEIAVRIAADEAGFDVAVRRLDE